jgi:acid phosphatase (class A)
MNLNLILKHSKIKNLSYDTQITEIPMSNLVNFDYKKILKPFPANTSKETQKELGLISKLTTNRNKEDCELIYKMDEDIDSYYKDITNKLNLSYPQGYIDLFYDIMRPVLMNLKSYWNRPRPNQLAELYNISINRIVTDTIHTASYPSGHTSYSRLVCRILSEMYPVLSNRFESVVALTEIARMKQGVHYPSDNKASIVFADYFYDQIHPKIVKYRKG